MMSPLRLGEIKREFAAITAFPAGVRLTARDEAFLIVALRDVIAEIEELQKRLDRLTEGPRYH